MTAGFCIEEPVVSRGKGTRYRGELAGCGELAWANRARPAPEDFQEVMIAGLCVAELASAGNEGE